MLAYAISNAMVKWASEQGYPLAEILFFRSGVALGLTAVVVLGNGGRESLRTANPAGHVIRGVVGLVAIALSYMAISLLPLSEATTISFSAPLFAILLASVVLKEKAGLASWIAAGVGFCGVLVMMRPDPGHMANIGLAVAIAGAFFAASATISVRQLTRTERGPSIVFYFLLFCTVVCAVPALLVWKAPDAFGWMMLIALGLVSGVMQLLFTQALRHAKPSVVGPFDYTQVVWAAIIGYVVWGEHLATRTLIGAAIVIGSGLYLVSREFRKPKRVV